ncbi:hypothetical protein [Rathayibacter sp. AY1C6]|uniref:hypothetical protein n=1 Tax=Rathayibacter sp. AY1C6 TaxID=2080539 RepID=UPI0011B00D24|nr:hypothetical protein [Rathayibacter sp. AY1C6]
MKDDALRKDLRDELRLLRRGSGVFGLDRVAPLEVLTEIVGRGSVEQAYTTLLDVLERDGKNLEGDIRAFFETAGLGLEGSNLDERLKAYAALHFEDQRTGLRRSDRGAERLSFILRDEFNYERPWANIIAAQSGGYATVGVTVNMPEYSQWRRPHVYINDAFQEGRVFELHDSTTTPWYVTGHERFPDIPLNTSSDVDTPLLEVKVVWVMPVWPSWQKSTHLCDPRLKVKLVNNRDYSAELSILWFSAEAAATWDRPLALYEPWLHGGDPS